MLLHGFGGSARSWDEVRAASGGEPYPALALDLRGHGARSADRPVTIDACVDDVLAVAPARFALAGYSLGGRVALRVALAAPERVARLVLVATTAGLEDPAQREARARSDDALADALLAEGLDAFAARWSAQPLFSGDPTEVRRSQESELRAGDADGLAAALRGCSPGRVAPVWRDLATLTMPTTVLVGGRDARYVGLGRRLAAALPDAELVVVEGAGHGLLREAPDAVAREVWR